MSVLSDKVLEMKAYSFRKRYGIEADAAIDYPKLLTSLNVITFYSNKMGDDFSGMAYKAKDDRFMMINSKHLLCRQHFTIGHELYHLFEQEDFKCPVCNTGTFLKENREEYNADMFSSFLLMPEAGIMSRIPEAELAWGGRISLATVIKLEQYFGVSRLAMLKRLDKMNLLKPGDFNMYRRDVNKSALEHGYPTDLYKSTDVEMVVGDYGARAKELFDQQLISESHFHNLMKDIEIDIDKVEPDEQAERA